MDITTAIDIRQRNKERIRHAIQQHEKCTKAEIARETELSMATSSTALNEMLADQEIFKIDQTGACIGRPADIFTYNRDYLHTLAICTTIEDGADAVEYIVADALGRIMLREREPIEHLTVDLLEALVTSCILRDPLIRAVGLGIPGHTQEGYVTQCDIHTLEQVDFSSIIREKHDVTVVIENDVNIVTYRLYHECPERDFATLYFPSQADSFVGGGFIVNGRLLKGSTMFAGEVSYVARAFGVTSEEQTRLLDDREGFCRFAAQMVTAIACTINPPQLVMMGDRLDDAALDTIRELCRAILPSHDMPELRVDNNIFNNYAEGLVRLTLDRALFPTLI